MVPTTTQTSMFTVATGHGRGGVGAVVPTGATALNGLLRKHWPSCSSTRGTFVRKTLREPRAEGPGARTVRALLPLMPGRPP